LTRSVPAGLDRVGTNRIMTQTVRLYPQGKIKKGSNTLQGLVPRRKPRRRGDATQISDSWLLVFPLVAASILHGF